MKRELLKGIAATALVFALSAPMALGEAAKVKTPANDGSANLRAGAGMNYEVVGWGKNGDGLDVVSTSGNWAKVTLDKNGKTGYMHKSLISLYASNPQTPPASGDAGTVVTKNAGSSVNLRESANGKIITSLKAGTTFSILEKSGDWYKIKAGNFTGYIYKDYVKVGAAATTTGDVNLRTGAGNSFKIIKVLKKGTAITVLNKGAKWSYVNAGGTEGYVYNAYIG